MLLLDILLIVIILTCIVYCFVLNRRIQDLQNSRVEFARMIKELNLSVERASANIQELNDLSKKVHSELDRSISDANKVLQELLVVSEIANDLSKAIDSSIFEIRATKDSDIKNIALKKVNFDNNRFTDDDLVVEKSQDKKNNKVTNYTSIKNTEDIEQSINRNIEDLIDSSMQEEQNQKSKINLDKESYYDSLKKVSIKK